MKELTTLPLRTIPALLERSATEHRDRTWIRTDDLELTFGAAAERVGAIGGHLSGLGVSPGDVVVLTTRNTPDYLLALMAVTTIGAVAVAVNPAATSDELTGLCRQVAESGRLRLIVTDHEVLAGPAGSATASRLPRTQIIDVVELTTAVDHPVGSRPRIAVAEDDVAVLIPTSGTTGRSKLVMQTHRSYVMAGEGFPHWLGLDGNDVLMTALPIFHTNAFSYSTMGSLVLGAPLVLLPRFSGSGFLDAARRHGATTFNAVGAMIDILMKQPPREDDAHSPLRVAYGAPSPGQAGHLAFEERFGLTLISGYGLSESPYGLIWRRGTRPYGRLGELRQHPTLGTVNHARVIDQAGQDVAPGVPGELLLRNPTITPGYFGLADETAEALKDGWLHTGDLVTVDSTGTYTFLTRKKDVIRRRGENLAPAEVEDVLRMHPAVADAAVVAVPAAGLAEDEVKAYVQLQPGVEVTVHELQQHASAQLSPFKVPRFWQVVTEFPRTPTGRVMKREIAPSTWHPEIDLGSSPTRPAPKDLAHTVSTMTSPKEGSSHDARD